ncbi:MAG: aldo/keto reductase [Eggerthellaceae bacterium]
MRFPGSSLGRIDLKATERLVLDAVQRGVNYFDTAYLYRGSEEALGTILERNGLRDDVFVATKLPHGMCKTAADFDRFLDEQLKRLKTNRVDYYLVHNIMSFGQWERLVGLGIEAWIAEKKRSGAMARIGFSFHGSQGDFMRMLDAYDWDFCQIQYNYLNEQYQAGRAGLEAAAGAELPVIVMEPLWAASCPTACRARRCARSSAPTASGRRRHGRCAGCGTIRRPRWCFRA